MIQVEVGPAWQVNGALRTPKKKGPALAMLALRGRLYHSGSSLAGDVAVEPLSSSKTVSLKRFASDVASDEVKHQEAGFSCRVSEYKRHCIVDKCCQRSLAVTGIEVAAQSCHKMPSC